MPSADDVPGEVSRVYLAATLGIVPRALDRLTREAVLTKTRRGRYELADSVQRYLAYRMKGAASRASGDGGDRLKDARAREVEQRMAEKDRRLIDIAEAQDAVDQIGGIYLASIEGLPARITRNARERQRLVGIVDGERQRVADRLAEIAGALRTGKPAGDAAAADDA